MDEKIVTGRWENVSLADALRVVTDLTESVDLEWIRFSKGDFSSRVPTEKDREFAGRTQTLQRHRSDDQSVWVWTEYRTVILPETTDQSDVAVVITAALELKYRFAEVAEPDSRERVVFAKVLGVLESWPYWREFLQSTWARMQLPNIHVTPIDVADAARMASFASDDEKNATG